ncbi:MAG: MFS transporter [Bacteroidota bacterium]
MKGPSNSYINTLFLLIAITAVAIDVSIPVLPSVTDYFRIEKDRAPLIISAFLAGYGLTMIPTGLISDRYGRLPIMYIGLVIYVLGGLSVVFASSFNMVLLGRFFQGIGGSVGPVNARAIARDMTSGKALAKLLSAMTAAIFLAPIFAPIIGGSLDNKFGWQIAFLLPPVLGIILLVSVLITAYETLPKLANRPSIGRQIIKSSKAYISSPKSVWALLLISISFPGYQIILANASVLMTEIYGIDSSYVGTIFGLSATLMVAASLINKKASQSMSTIRLLGIGIVLSLCTSAGWLLCHFMQLDSFILVWVFFSIHIAATGIILANTTTIALEPLPNIAAFASSVFGSATVLGSAIATAAAAQFYNGTLISITACIMVSTLASAVIYFVGLVTIKR